MDRTTCYDVHCHAFTMAHPNFLAFLETIRNRKLEALYSQASAPDYLASSLFLKGGERIRNMLSVMENDVGSIFLLMEDDLAGRYSKPGDGQAPLSGDELSLGPLSFDRLVIVPLIMDFQGRSFAIGETYYDKAPAKPVSAQVRDVLSGIRDYRRARPDGFLEIRPFLGINPANRGMDELEDLLDKSFAGYVRGREAGRAAFEAMRRFFHRYLDAPLSSAPAATGSP